MILYKHETKDKNELITKKYEAEEKPKTYFLTNSNGWQNRVLKTDIGKLTGHYNKYMYTLTPDAKPFLIALNEHYEKMIAGREEALLHLKEKQNHILKLLESEGKNNVKC